ncbi:hypothetical protein CLOM_g23083 [Closterium sp. NIES-68]|nr:hypothetical protein CLOM_g23083 [Closterium sp. NIES-68]GJP61525.1 hypothetical protein CLOP_g18677 [Closterium sp. NIES-67]
MGKREDNDSTNLPLVKVGRFGRVTVAEQGAEDRDAAAYKRLMALMKEEARPIGYLHGRGALDHDDLNYLREHIRAEEETEKLRQHSEKRAFAALKAAAAKSESSQPPALASPAASPSAPPKAKFPNRQKALLKAIVEVKPKRPRLEQGNETEAPAKPEQSSKASNGARNSSSLGGSILAPSQSSLEDAKSSAAVEAKEAVSIGQEGRSSPAEPSGPGLLGLAYDDDSDEE